MRKEIPEEKYSLLLGEKRHVVLLLKEVDNLGRELNFTESITLQTCKIFKGSNIDVPVLILGPESCTLIPDGLGFKLSFQVDSDLLDGPGSYVALFEWHEEPSADNLKGLIYFSVIDLTVPVSPYGALVNAIIAGINGSIQYNDSGALAGDNELTWDNILKLFKVLGTIQSGLTGTSQGTFKIAGLTSGEVIITTKNEAGTWTMTLPDNTGMPDQVLATDGIGNLKWSSMGDGSGNVVGPAGATDGNLAVFDSTSGKLIKDGGPIPDITSMVSGDGGAAAGNVAVFNGDGFHITDGGAFPIQILPGGFNNQIQFNDNGTAFRGSGGLEYVDGMTTYLNDTLMGKPIEGDNISSGYTRFCGASGTGTGTGGPLVFAAVPAGTTPGQQTNPYVDYVFLHHDGHMGIGTEGVETPSALLNLNSTNSGFLMPRMSTEQRDAISSPETGLLIFNLTTLAFNYFDGSNWIEI